MHFTQLFGEVKNIIGTLTERLPLTSSCPTYIRESIIYCIYCFILTNHTNHNMLVKKLIYMKLPPRDQSQEENIGLTQIII